MSFDLHKMLMPVKGRYEELSALMSGGALSGEAFVKLSREYAELTPVVEAIQSYEKALREFSDLEAMLDDPEMRDMAEEEYYALKDRLPQIENELKLTLLPRDEADNRDILIEIRAGTGGDEAALFVADLFAMYKGYASCKGWRMEVVEASPSDLGGYREIIAEISGQNVYAHLKFESGVHRVQRVPLTEASGRIHTSAATVAVLPQAEDVDIEIREGDLRIDTYRSQGAGGQHVNTTDSAIRITHIPSGLVVACQEERSQIKNRAKAMKLLRTRLYDLTRTRLQQERAADRKSQVGSGDRSERIRTYNYPQSRVTDHRVNVTLYKIDDIMTGEALDEVIEPLIAHDQAERLLQLEG